jgi:pimeloyl-ACP methyl ester carboxylesterase
MAEGIRDFTLNVPEATLADLRERLHRGRLPEAETVNVPGAGLDWSQGAPLSYVRELAEYWADQYDWRRLESELNRHGQSITRIDGLDLHFLHLRSDRPDARPLVLSHGWPASVVEALEVMDELANPPSAQLPAFHVVAPSLPGFGFSAKPDATGWNVDRIADAWALLMTRLGYDRFFAVGGDWAGRVTAGLGTRHPDRVAGLHTFTPYVSEPPDGPGDLSPQEAEWVEGNHRFYRSGGGYSLEQSTRPQTVAYALVDSPIAQLAWVLEKFQGWTDCDGHPENAVSRDRILDNVMMYWLPATGGSSARIYWENFPPERGTRVAVPTAVTVFPKDIERFPRRWVEQRFRDLRYWHVAERGGHFPALEVPASYVAEIQQSLARIAAG